MDNELDELLDSALDDFEKNKEEKEIKKQNDLDQQQVSSSIVSETLTTTTTTTVINETASGSSVTIEKTNLNVEIDLDNKNPPQSNKNNSKTQTSSSTIDDDMKLFDEIFNDEQSKEAFKQFTGAFGMFKNDQPEMLKEFEKMMETLTNNKDLNLYEDDVDDDDDRDQARARAQNTSSAATATAAASNTQNQKPLDKVLENMNKQSEKLLKNDDDFTKLTENFLLSQLNLNDNDDADDPESSLLMQPLISMLFSKDILYPSLKMMLDNYNKYLDENKDKLNTVDYNKYCEQKECITKMCDIYEQGKETDTEEAKSSQLKKILELLEKCGNPPKELVPEINPFAAMGGNFMKDSCPIS